MARHFAAEAKPSKTGGVSRVAYGFICLAAPLVIFVAISIANGIYPFGPESFLTEDLRFQYTDFYAWFIRVLRGEASLFYNPYTGMGTNAWGIYSYYLASPANLLLPFFGERRLALFVYVTTGIKLSLMCLSMCWYMRARFGVPRPAALALALCYTWSTWVATQLRNPMWLDALIILPAAAWATYVLVREQKLLPLALSIACAIITCWYMAYMLCAFLILFFCLECVDAQAPAGSYGRCLARFVGAVCLGLALSAFTFAPTVLQMLGTSANEVSELPLDNGWQAIDSGLLLLGWLRDYTPQLFGGTLLVLLVAAFVVSGDISLRTRVVGVAMLAFLIWGTTFPPLQFAWSGFKSPHGFYCRMCWLIIFCGVWMAGKTLQSGRAQKNLRRSVVIGAILAVAFAGLSYAFCEYGNRRGLMYMCASAAAGAALLLGGHGMRGAWANRCLGALCVLVMAELALSSRYCWKELYTEYTQSYDDAYVAEALDQVAELRARDDGWYRAEKIDRRLGMAINDGMARGFRSLSTYCSSYNGNAVNFLNDLGYSHPGKFSMAYTAPILVMDSLLGVRYVSTYTQPIAYEDTGLMNATTSFPVLDPRFGLPACFYRNPYALGLAYGVADSAVGSELIAGVNPFEKQNSLVSALLGREVEPYRRVTPQPTGDAYAWEVTVPAGSIGYAYTAPFSFNTFLQIDDLSYVENYHWRYTVQELADARGEETRVSVSLSSGEADHELADEFGVEDACLFYALDFDVFSEAMAELSARQALVRDYGDDWMTLDYTAAEDGYLLVSIPRENGWQATVNGRAVQLVSAGSGALTLVPVVAGENSVELSFTVPGLMAGAIISAVSALICGGGFAWKRLLSSRRLRT